MTPSSTAIHFFKAIWIRVKACLQINGVWSLFKCGLIWISGMPDSRDRYAASHNRPYKMYSCVCMCWSREAGAQCISAQPSLCEIMWSRVLCSSSTQATQPPCPSHFRLSLLAAFSRNRPRWSTPRKFH
jgi:hypothetical protein